MEKTARDHLRNQIRLNILEIECSANDMLQLRSHLDGKVIVI